LIQLSLVLTEKVFCKEVLLLASANSEGRCAACVIAGRSGGVWGSAPVKQRRGWLHLFATIPSPLNHLIPFVILNEVKNLEVKNL
jgi:hypothetical protein